MRIPFIDVAKGISILLVVMVHVAIPEPFMGAYAAKVPIFFFLAGLFFLTSVNRGGYLSKKVKSILVPFSIYYVLSYALFYTIAMIKPNVLIGDNTFSITDLFTQRNLFNEPLWFLLSLFWVETTFYLIFTQIKVEWIRACVVFTLATVGFILAETDIFLPLWFDTSFVALIYFYFGYILSLRNWLTKNIEWYWLIIIGLLAYGLFLLMPVTISMSVNNYSNPIFAVTSGALIILFILVVSKLLSRVTILAWIGTNSLVLLCTHHIIYRSIKYFQIQFGMNNPYILFTSTIVINVLIILLINKFAPILAGKYPKKSPLTTLK